MGIKFFTPDDFFVEGDLPDFVLNAADKSKESPKKETKATGWYAYIAGNATK